MNSSIQNVWTKFIKKKFSANDFGHIEHTKVEGPLSSVCAYVLTQFERSRTAHTVYTQQAEHSCAVSAVWVCRWCFLRTPASLKLRRQTEQVWPAGPLRAVHQPVPVQPGHRTEPSTRTARDTLAGRCAWRNAASSCSCRRMPSRTRRMRSALPPRRAAASAS